MNHNNKIILTLSTTERRIDIGTLVVPFQQTSHPLHKYHVVSHQIEPTVHTSCYWAIDLLCVTHFSRFWMFTFIGWQCLYSTNCHIEEAWTSFLSGLDCKLQTVITKTRLSEIKWLCLSVLLVLCLTMCSKSWADIIRSEAKWLKSSRNKNTQLKILKNLREYSQSSHDSFW